MFNLRDDINQSIDSPASACKCVLCVLIFQMCTVMWHAAAYTTCLIMGWRFLLRTSNKKSQSPHFRFPLFLFMADTVSHNAQERLIYLGHALLVRVRVCEPDILPIQPVSPCLSWFVSGICLSTSKWPH